MQQATTSPAAHRLARLAAFLQEDPENPALLADACESAIACGDHARAEAYIASAERLALDRSEWTFRRARLAIARRDLAQAAQLLEGLIAGGGPHPVLAHDLAYVRLLQGDPEAVRMLLRPWVEPGCPADLPPAQQQALQVLWLRAAHRLQLLEEAMEWTARQEAAGALHPAAGGVASLVAVDLEDFATARRLAEAALASDPAQVEALVARGSVALAQGDSALATQFLQRGLERQPDDGRTWSALGFASLQAMNLPQARTQLERAVQSMPDHVETWHALGWTLLLQGERDAALAAFRRALDLGASSAETHGGLALLLAMSGEAEQARGHLDEAERLEPGNATGRLARAMLAGELRDAKAVQALIEPLLRGRGLAAGALADLMAALQRGAK